MSCTHRILGLTAALLAATALATPAVAGKADNSVRFAFTGGAIPNLDPYFNTLLMGTVLADQVWDTLVYRDPETGEYKGALATAWHQVDNRTLEFELRRGVKFHNGAEFGADDVVYTLNFVSNPDNKAVQLSLVRWIDHVEKLDNYRVRIVTRQPFPAAIATLASPKVAIFPHSYYAKVGPAGMNQKPVGTGPYRVVEHAIGKHVLLERNPDYFRDSPKAQPRIATVEMRFIPDPQTRVAEMVSGGLDLIMYVARDQAEQLRPLPQLQIVSGETSGYTFLHLNTMERTPAPPLRDVRVRQAIMHAIDRETIVKHLVGETARVLHTECFPGQFGCTDEGVVRYAYDPAQAKRLLAEAGYANGFEFDFYAFTDRNIVEAIIGYLRAVGIRARLRYLSLTAVVSAQQAGRVALAQAGWSNPIADVSNAVSRFHQFSPGADLSRDAEVRDLLQRADSAMDPGARKEAYAAAFKLIADRAYTLPLYSIPNYYVAAKDLVLRSYTDTVPRFYEMSWK
jgi:peptide/nickel transport system substrate-binding protein